MGVAEEESAYSSAAISPSKDSWEEDDRTTYCALSEDGMKLTGSKEGLAGVVARRLRARHGSARPG